MKKIVLAIFCIVSTVFLYAGDVATFVDLGFSADGTRFVFGQYGTTDTDFRAYADVFCVDTVKNDFVPNGFFSTLPSVATSGKDGRGVFAALQNDAAPFLKKLGVDSALQGRALYVRAENGTPADSLEFRDFETGTDYSVTIHTLVEGAGASVRASFYLVVEIRKEGSKPVRKTVGIPGYLREGVTAYLVRRIISDASGKSVVFIIEKELFEKKGNSARYMVETLRL